MLKPMKLLLERVDVHGADSDATMFMELLYAGEFIVKCTASAMVSLIQNDREGHRYRLLHSLVRADGVGEWAAALDQACSGPASQSLTSSALEIRRVFTERAQAGSWQDEAVQSLYSVLHGIYPEAPPPADRPQLRTWFQTFAELRNKTRGHGALTPAKATTLVGYLLRSIKLMSENNPIFFAPWAYLHRNLSGKYRVVPLGGDSSVFSHLSSGKGIISDNFAPGIYIWVGICCHVELLYTDVNTTDFFIPNGAFKNGKFELHSLISDLRREGDASAYLQPATERPGSETEGRSELEALGSVFTNLPAKIDAYVSRPNLEKDIRAAFENDRHPVVTLVGRGGVGKTSTALSVLHEICKTNRYYLIIWFSARDIDLTTSGAKPVKPQILTESEISREYVKLTGTFVQKNESSTSIMAKHLSKSPIGPTLFVFDNFETVRSPIDLFSWIDTNIRLPNKAIITSRFRDFKADFPIPVPGMEEPESQELVNKTAQKLGISSLIGSKEIAEIIEESDGHPYVIKILLGEIANIQKYNKPARLIARKEDILDALFERTYASLAPLAARTFLVLASWRSLVPQIAVEAALLRQTDEAVDPEAAIDQLVRTSLVERVSAPDGSDFLEVPLAAAIFGKQKLAVSPFRAIIENDVKFLQEVGATATTGLKEGLAPKINSFFKSAARKISLTPAYLEEIRPILEFLAIQHKPAWLLLADIDQELGNIEIAAKSLRRFLEGSPSPQLAQTAWRQLFQLYYSTGDVIAACDAFLRSAAISDPPISEVSSIANWLNNSQEAWSHLHTTERTTIFKPIAQIMEKNLSLATATDLSRTAWLYLHSGDTERAFALADEGLAREPNNVHCTRLVAKLNAMR